MEQWDYCNSDLDSPEVDDIAVILLLIYLLTDIVIALVQRFVGLTSPKDLY